MKKNREVTVKTCMKYKTIPDTKVERKFKKAKKGIKFYDDKSFPSQPLRVGFLQNFYS